MLANFFAILGIIAPVFVIAAIGFFWSQQNLPYNGEFISRFVMNIACPCLIVATLSTVTIASNDVWQLSIITLTGLMLYMLVYAVVAYFSPHDWRGLFNTVVFANTGNMGVPIAYFAFGDQGLAMALVVFMVTSLLHFSVGVSLPSGAHPLKTLAKAPVFYAAMVAFGLLLSPVKLPQAVFNSIDLIGDTAIPLMLLSLGVSLHSLKLSLFKRSLAYALLRLLLGFAVGWLLSEWFALQGTLRGVVIIQSAMPSAVFNYLIASRYQREEATVAGVVVLSTILSFASLPFLLWYLL